MASDGVMDVLDSLDRYMLERTLRSFQMEIDTMPTNQQFQDAITAQSATIDKLKTALEKVIADVETIRSSGLIPQSLLDQINASGNEAQAALDEANAEDASINPPPPPPPPAPATPPSGETAPNL